MAIFGCCVGPLSARSLCVCVRPVQVWCAERFAPLPPTPRSPKLTNMSPPCRRFSVPASVEGLISAMAFYAHPALVIMISHGDLWLLCWSAKREVVVCLCPASAGLVCRAIRPFASHAALPEAHEHVTALPPFFGSSKRRGFDFGHGVLCTPGFGDHDLSWRSLAAVLVR